MARWMYSWDWWGNFFYLVPSIGYAYMDFTTGWCSDDPFPSFMSEELTKALWVIMAVVFVIDSVFYLFGWLSEANREGKARNAPMKVESRFWGEWYNVVSSVGWVVVAGLVYTLPDEPTNAELVRYWMLYGIASFVSATLMFVSNLLYLTGWRTDVIEYPTPNSRKTCGFWLDFPFWAQLMDTVGGLIYLVGTGILMYTFIGVLFDLPFDSPAQIDQLALSATGTNCTGVIIPLKGGSGSDNEFDIEFDNADKMNARINFFGDIAYIIDSILYMICWKLDHRKSGDPSDTRDHYSSLVYQPVSINDDSPGSVSDINTM